MRIGLQLLCGLVLIFALAAWFVLEIFVEEIKPGVRSATEDTLVDMAQMLAPLALDDLQEGKMADGRLASAFARLNQSPINALIDGHLKQQAEYRIYVTDAKGKVVYDSDGVDLGKDYSRWNDVYRTLRGQYGARSTRSDPDDPASSVMHVAAPLREGGSILGSLTVAKPNRTLMPMIERSEHQLLQAAAMLLLISLLIGALLAWWLNRAIGKLVHYADAVSHNQPATLPGLHSPELERLGRSLETMRRQLDGKAYIESYVHSLTHELKSPLAAIRGAGELLAEAPPPEVARRFIGNINLETARMQQLIERMLQLAKLESGQGLDRQATEPARLGKRVLDARQIIAQRRQVTLVAELADASKQKWDPLLVEQALGNLLDNALDFSPAGSTVRLTGEMHADGYRFQVRDQGPGIPDYALPRIFERFYSLPRPDKGKSSGLGLSFATEVARQHGGRLNLCNQPEGGVLAELWLPAGGHFTLGT
ncbi:beta-lactam sensor histidine kinase BlrB [Aeromonas salmonicida]|uniref:beta-lactam sensor histidine kinase BlrB n=1 Tax=Aeromonas salmonicida TaxID=645 RepID=UPI00044B3019|nr:beta-lactam sensor histidine kinase BlrB [Aeromonas salmonicida]ATD37256.1 two-component system sensor histidine kinase CreC [Aeromonas salmonicida subsp. masoucida]ELI6404119.1 beta-lactam sensor histidine kinase BlrB [Aeromonas salmonicida subsp. salmonicida]ELI6407748.1 beta-lactam sensor histidine kinase BlrB [Aeromonas salmonicida subsp. salmonicida]ELI6417120.1 beta-lactam sensor histidine kinase BlrB [Aeromonas salmonicida subsp. salmonicida]ELI6434586.1 beta-lactam sensor histidine 